jgi:hypothetical protein
VGNRRKRGGAGAFRGSAAKRRRAAGRDGLVEVVLGVLGVVATAENVHFPCGVIDSIKHDVGVADDWHLVVRQPRTPALVAAWEMPAMLEASGSKIRNLGIEFLGAQSRTTTRGRRTCERCRDSAIFLKRQGSSGRSYSLAPPGVCASGLSSFLPADLLSATMRHPFDCDAL